ncbi:MAG TPA: ATP-binding protein [Gemmatimonadales bacterium]|nr:ATP-binding protein [Gemmatimonadales bacterium]
MTHDSRPGTAAASYQARVERLLALIAELNAATTPAAVAHAVLDAGLAAAGASAAYLGLTSADGQRLELLDQVGFPEARVAQARALALDLDLPVCVAARHGEPLFLESQTRMLAAHPDAAPLYAAGRAHDGAVAALPLLGRAGAFGALSLRYAAPVAFDTERRALLLALAGLAAQALERVRLLAAAEAERARADAAADQVRRLQAVSDALAAHLSLDALLPEALERVRAALEADLAAITLLEPDGTHLRVHASVGVTPAEFAPVRVPLGRGFAGVVAERGRPWVVADIREIEVVGGVTAAHGIASLAGVPLRIGERVLGTVTLGWRARRTLAGAELELLEQAAARIAVAIDRSQAHEELRRRKNEYESLVEHSPDVIARFDRAGRHVYVNRAMIEASGGRMTPELLLGRTQAELGVPEDTERLTREVLARVFATGEPVRYTFESVALWAPGHVDVLAVPEFAADGRTVEHVLLIARDVTALHRARAAAEASEARLRRVIESPMIGIGFWRDGVVTEANAALLAMLGWTRAELEAGLLTTERITPEDMRARDRAARAAGLRTGVGAPYEKDFLRKDGTRLPALVGGAALGDADGTVVFYVLDLTERRRAQAQLEEAQRMEAVGRLAGGVAHEIRNALQGVLGFASFAARGLDPAEPRARDIEQIRRAGERAAQVAQQLLAFSRRQMLQPTTLDLAELVRAFAPMLRQALGPDRHLVLDLAPGACTVSADRGQLEQVLVNLALNARDAMGPGGQLTVAVDRDGADEVRLRVRDTGDGMAPEAVERAFEPFYTTKPTGQGTGLGLAVVHGIVRQSGGRIALASAAGAGTTITIHLPAVAPAAAPEPPAPPIAGPRGAGETILLVEDEAMLRDLGGRILREAGYRVLTAEHGAAALQVLETSTAAQPPAPVRVVVTDLVMPVMDGAMLADAIAARDPALPVLLVSGVPDEVHTLRGAAGRSRFVAKPVQPEVLLREVRAALDGGS